MPSYMSTMKYIQLEPREEIAIIRINRPEALNAMNVDVIAEEPGIGHSAQVQILAI
jgi:enoyl-CoA hydratase/carnithine racemase